MTARSTDAPIQVSLMPDVLGGLPNSLLIRIPNPWKIVCTMNSKRICMTRDGSARLEQQEWNDANA
jgi:hypothetical protein